jgi:hypothetical protein
LRGVLRFPPHKVVSLKKGRGKKRKKRKKRKKKREENRRHHLEREEKLQQTAANFERGGTKFASYDIPLKNK